MVVGRQLAQAVDLIHDRVRWCVHFPGHFRWMGRCPYRKAGGDASEAGRAVRVVLGELKSSTVLAARQIVAGRRRPATIDQGNGS